MRIPEKTKERFHSLYKVNSETGCWEWQNNLHDNGYGRIKIRGFLERAHRVSYAIHKGPIPGGMLVCHTCDVRHCVNPDHLWLGTPLENTKDMLSKGRQRHVGQRGEDNPRSLLSKQKVEQIIRMIADGYSNKAISQEFNVSHSTVSLIRRGKIWTDIPRPSDNPCFGRYASLRYSA